MVKVCKSARHTKRGRKLSQHLFSMRKVSSKPILTKNSSAAPKLLLNSMIHSPNGVVGRRALSPRQGARKDRPHGRRWTARDLPSGSALSGHAQSGHTPTRPHPFTPPPLNQRCLIQWLQRRPQPLDSSRPSPSRMPASIDLSIKLVVCPLEMEWAPGSGAGPGRAGPIWGRFDHILQV